MVEKNLQQRLNSLKSSTQNMKLNYGRFTSTYGSILSHDKKKLYIVSPSSSEDGDKNYLSIGKFSNFIEFLEEKVISLPENLRCTTPLKLFPLNCTSQKQEVLIEAVKNENSVCGFFKLDLNNLNQNLTLVTLQGPGVYRLVATCGRIAMITTPEKNLTEINGKGVAKTCLAHTPIRTAQNVTEKLISITQEQNQNFLLHRRSKKILRRGLDKKIIDRFYFQSEYGLIEFLIENNKNILVKNLTFKRQPVVIKYEGDSYYKNNLLRQQDPSNPKLIYFIFKCYEEGFVSFWNFDIEQFKIISKRKINCVRKNIFGDTYYSFRLLAIMNGTADSVNIISECDDAFVLSNFEKDNFIKKKPFFLNNSRIFNTGCDGNLLSTLTSDSNIIISDIKTMRTIKAFSWPDFFNKEEEIIHNVKSVFLFDKKILIINGKKLSLLDMETLKIIKTTELENCPTSAQSCGKRPLILISYKKTDRCFYLVDFELEIKMWSKSLIPEYLKKNFVFEYLYNRDLDQIRVEIDRDIDGEKSDDVPYYYHLYYSGKNFEKFEGYHITPKSEYLEYKPITGTDQFLVLNLSLKKVRVTKLMNEFNNKDFQKILKKENDLLIELDELKDLVYICEVENGCSLFFNQESRSLVKYDPLKNCFIDETQIANVEGRFLTYSFKINKKEILLIYDRRIFIRIDIEAMQEIDRKDIILESMNEGKNLKETALSLCYLDCFKDFIHEKVRILELLAKENDLSMIKTVLDILGYPISSPEMAGEMDPYLRLRDNKEVKRELKDLLKEWYFRSGMNEFLSLEKDEIEFK